MSNFANSLTSQLASLGIDDAGQATPSAVLGVTSDTTTNPQITVSQSSDDHFTATMDGTLSASEAWRKPVGLSTSNGAASPHGSTQLRAHSTTPSGTASRSSCGGTSTPPGKDEHDVDWEQEYVAEQEAAAGNPVPDRAPPGSYRTHLVVNGGSWLHLLNNEGGRRTFVLEESFVQSTAEEPATAAQIPQFRLEFHDTPQSEEDVDRSWQTGWMTGRRGGREQSVPGQSLNNAEARHVYNAYSWTFHGDIDNPKKVDVTTKSVTAPDGVRTNVKWQQLTENDDFYAPGDTPADRIGSTSMPPSSSRFKETEAQPQSRVIIEWTHLRDGRNIFIADPQDLKRQLEDSSSCIHEYKSEPWYDVYKDHHAQAAQHGTRG
ncbi:hypothetical protein IAT40_001526 [Kwoniella sp. CBS 6097]